MLTAAAYLEEALSIMAIFKHVMRLIVGFVPKMHLQSNISFADWR
jgi:hypothetical protein